MEVHHHSHTSRKKWTHYFWEFLMLFLAVTLGFFVENQREHYIENHRADQYAISLLTDMKQDTSQLANIIESRTERKYELNRLMDELEKPLNEQDDTVLFRIGAFEFARRAYFNARTGTYEQIQNSGALRYFPTYLAAELVDYKANINLLEKQLDIENKYIIENVINMRSKFCNQKYLRYEQAGKEYVVKERLISKDHEIQSQVYSAINFLLERNEIYLYFLKETKAMSVKLINDLNEKFNLR